MMVNKDDAKLFSATAPLLSRSIATAALGIACLFTGGTALGQHSGSFEGYPVGSLNDAATQSPAFPDQTSSDHSSMSPDSWGGSSQSYYSGSYSSDTMPSATNTPTAASSHAYQPGSVQGNQNLFNQALFQQPAARVADVRTRADLYRDAPGPLVNTGDHRIESGTGIGGDLPNSRANGPQQNQQRQAAPAAQASPSPFRNASYPLATQRIDELTAPPELPEVKFPFKRKERAEPATSSLPTRTPAATASPYQSPGDNSGLIEIGSHDELMPNAPEATAQNSVSPLANSQPQQPIVNQPATNQPIERVAPGPTTSQWGFSYPESPGYQSAPHVEPPFQVDSQFATGCNQCDNGVSAATGATGSSFFQMTPADGSQPAVMMPSFRPDLGHRDIVPTIRPRNWIDTGEKFPHESKKKEYPPFKEIIATGRFFGGADLAVITPRFLGNTALSVDGPTFSESQAFDFDEELSPMFRVGFESKYGPGIELTYFNLQANSNQFTGTSDGTTTVNSIASINGPGRFSAISADDPGEQLTANHSFDMETFGFTFFKEVEFPISRLNGKFGFLYANVAQSLLARVDDAAGNFAAGLTNTTDFRGLGPQFNLEYLRPLGHTPIALITSFGGKGLFGRRDQFVSNTDDVVVRRFGADEFITVIDFSAGIQYRKTTAENRNLNASLAFVHQSWLGGGTAVDPQGDFGLRGIRFGVGYNR